MSEILRETFLPTKLRFYFGELVIVSPIDNKNTFVCDKELEEDLELSEIIVQNSVGSVIDIIPRETKLSKGDILHFEYKLDVKFW